MPKKIILKNVTFVNLIKHNIYNLHDNLFTIQN